jgi:hypothetical protein
MTLSSYSGLASSVAGWLMRDDLAAVIPDFISLAEADMTQRLRLRCMLTRSTTTLGSDGYEELPSDFLGMWRLTLDDEELMFSPNVRLAGYALDYAGESPMYYAIVGTQVQFVPVGAGGGALEMTYYAKPAALSESNPSNVLLEASPALYLYGSLLASAPYLGDDARVQTWGALYTQACDVLQAADDAAEFSAGPLVIRSGSLDMTP